MSSSEAKIAHLRGKIDIAESKLVWHLRMLDTMELSKQFDHTPTAHLALEPLLLYNELLKLESCFDRFDKFSDSLLDILPGNDPLRPKIEVHQETYSDLLDLSKVTVQDKIV